jgi:hypothetical protein
MRFQPAVFPDELSQVVTVADAAGAPACATDGPDIAISEAPTVATAVLALRFM